MKLHSQGTSLDLDYPHVMGILNTTPDSFYDGGKYQQLSDALTHVNAMVNAGATIVDIGGESTRPGADNVSVEQELERVIPFVEAVARRFDVWISVDTSKAEVIREAARAGAHIINDIRALSAEAAMLAVAESGLPVCLMHMQGEPRTMQQNPVNGDVLQTVQDFFSARISACCAAGIEAHRLLLDPGFGFGKTVKQNYQLLANLALFHRFELPLMVGLSRKSMIGKITHAGPAQRLSGSIACAVIAAMQGAQIIRVHDVKETVEAIRIVEATRRDSLS